jgi:SAM-dependent methyltransferase
MGSPISYLDNFHDYHFKNSIDSATIVIPEILKIFDFNTVLDVGCGIGTWLKVFKEHDIKVAGIDGLHVDKSKLLIEPYEFIAHDLNLPFDLQKKYDLVISMEVAEHLEQKNAIHFIKSLCLHGDVILFSAAIPGQEGTLHVNEQYNQYWVNIFAENGYLAFDSIRHELWNLNKISWWYRQNMLLFVNSDKLSSHKYVKSFDRANVFKNSYVHPDLFDHKTKKADYLSERVDYLTKTLNNPFRVLWYYFRALCHKFIK